MAKPKYKFVKQVEHIHEVIKAPDTSMRWNPDPSGYFLIRVDHTKNIIEAGFATYKHVITKKIEGKNASDIYNTIIDHKLITRLDHAAYLGKELFKAEVALKYGAEYKQEFALLVPGAKVKVKLKRES